MRRYRYTRKEGLVDETGRQVLILLASGCSQKFLLMAGKELANRLNTIEQGKKAPLGAREGG